MLKKLIGLILVAAILIGAFLMLESCQPLGGGQQPLAIITQ